MDLPTIGESRALGHDSARETGRPCVPWLFPALRKRLRLLAAHLQRHAQKAWLQHVAGVRRQHSAQMQHDVPRSSREVREVDNARSSRLWDSALRRGLDPHTTCLFAQRSRCVELRCTYGSTSSITGTEACCGSGCWGIIILERLEWGRREGWYPACL